MVPNNGPNRMAQYARNTSGDSGLANGDGAANSDLADQLGQKRSSTPQILPLSRQAITETAKLPTPAPKPSAPPKAQFPPLHQPVPSGQLKPQSLLLPLHPSPEQAVASPPRQQRQRPESRQSDRTGFWPESQIDSHIGSPTTQRSERYDAAFDDLPETTLPMPKLKEGLPYTVGRNGEARMLSSNRGPGLPAIGGGMPMSYVEPARHQDAYLSEPNFLSPSRRPPTSVLHNTAVVRRSYVPPPNTYNDDREGFSEVPPYQIPSHNLKRAKKDDKFQETRRRAIFQEEEVDGSLASDYPVSEEGNGTPRASRKIILPRETALLESNMPSSTRTQRDKANKRRRDNCDYADAELAGMTYSQLREQPFDDDPGKKSPQPIGPLTADSLPVKLDHFRGQREADQKQFFMQMTVSDWERSGDWFLEQFGQIAQKLKDARQEKRVMVEEFEKEIASREEAVRLRTENITKKLNKIKHKGEDMLADKEV